MRRAVATLLTVAVFVLPACQGGGDDEESTNTTSESKVETPKKGGTFRLGSTRITTLDPAQARSVEELLIADQLFDGLTHIDSEKNEAVPRLVTRWRTTPDQKVWDFDMDGPATFSDGRKIKAEDVKYSLDRIARKGSGSPGADLLSLVEGYTAVSEGTANDLSGVSVLGETIRIALTAPWAELPAVLASPQFGIVDKSAVEVPAEAKPFATDPSVTSGPFTFARREAETLVLNRADGSTALLDRIEVREYPDVGAAYADFTEDKLDWSRVPPEEVDGAGEKYGRETFHPYVAELFYGFNMKNPKFADVRFREAIVRSVDRDAIATAVYVGTVKPIDGVIVEGVPGHQERPCGDKCTHDVARAKQLLTEVFGTNPVPEVLLNFDEDPTQERVAKAIEANLKEVGIPVRLVPKPAAEYGDFVVSGQQDLFRLGWIAAYASPDAFVSPLFQSQSRDNIIGYSSPTVDFIVNAARSEPDRTKRLSHYQEAERAVMSELPIIPIAQFRLFAVTSSKVRGLALTATGSFDGAKVWLTDAG